MVGGSCEGVGYEVFEGPESEGEGRGLWRGGGVWRVRMAIGELGRVDRRKGGEDQM